MSEQRLTKEEKDILLELIFNEQTKNLIIKDKYETDKYKQLEELKMKIKNM